jgi:aldose sugar dehydrogenase
MTLLPSPFYAFNEPELALASSGVPATDEISSAGIQTANFPSIYDINVKAEIVYDGLEFPSSMAFLGPSDVLVLEKNKGTVQRIINGKMAPYPMLGVSISNQSERGLLGIAVERNEEEGGTANIFLYFTRSSTKENSPVVNSLYKYDLVDNRLVKPKKLLDLPRPTGPGHNGGALAIGPDNNVYFTGDLNVLMGDSFLIKAENIEKGRDPDGRAGILRVTQNGEPVPNGSLIGDQYLLNPYYAYGIRNSFGVDFDPVTGDLWDTENGPNFGDEINIVEPGFNSGWNKVQGIWKADGGPVASSIMSNRDENYILVNFDQRTQISEFRQTRKTI